MDQASKQGFHNQLFFFSCVQTDTRWGHRRLPSQLIANALFGSQFTSVWGRVACGAVLVKD